MRVKQPYLRDSLRLADWHRKETQGIEENLSMRIHRSAFICTVRMSKNQNFRYFKKLYLYSVGITKTQFFELSML